MNDLSPTLRPLAARFGWLRRQVARDLRSPSLHALIAAVTLAVAAFAAVGWVAERMQRALTRDAAVLLGGDAVLAGDAMLDARWGQQAQALGLRVARQTQLVSMARAPSVEGSTPRLVSLKAVDASWPLRGDVQIRDPAGVVSTVRHGPPRGAAWVDAGLLPVLGVQPGGELAVGDLTLRIAAVLTREPDRGAGFSAMAPRVLIHRDDLEPAGLVQPGSRLRDRIAVVGPVDAAGAAAVARWRAAVEARLGGPAGRGLRLETLTDGGRGDLQRTLDRATPFLQLVALMTAWLGIVVVVVAAQDHVRRQLDAAALLRVLGLGRAGLLRQQAVLLGGVVGVGSAVGLALGWALQAALWAGLRTWLPDDPPLPGPRLWVLGPLLAALLVGGFAAPVMVELARVPPLRVQQRNLGQPRRVTALALGLAALAVAGLLATMVDVPRLAALALGGLLVASLVLAGAGWALARGVRALAAPGRAGRAGRWRQVARALAAQPGLVALQVAALGLGLTALLTLTGLRTGLLDEWRAMVPTEAPDRFLVNVQPDQRDAVRARILGSGVPATALDWEPTFRGRLVAVNGRPVEVGAKGEDDRARRLLEREFNLGHRATLPEHNTVVAGAWTPEAPDALSVEEGLARTLGLALGDRLTFDVAGSPLEGRITSLRRLQWSSMRLNFFVLVPRQELPDVPATWLAAWQQRDPALDRELLQTWPNLTVVDVGATVEEVRRVVGQVSRAIEGLFVLALVTGLLVMAATVRAGREVRQHEAAVQRALGASRGWLRQVQGLEMAGVGALAGGLAGLLAWGLVALLARQVMGWQVPGLAWLVPLGGLVGAALAAGVAAWALRGVTSAPVLDSLRRHAG